MAGALDIDAYINPRATTVAERTAAAEFGRWPLYSVLVVDDGSTDGSFAALEGLPLERLRLAENSGKGAAILAGAARAGESDALRPAA